MKNLKQFSQQQKEPKDLQVKELKFLNKKEKSQNLLFQNSSFQQFIQKQQHSIASTQIIMLETL